MDNEEMAIGHREGAERNKPSMSVKIGTGEWYAIPPSMAEAFRKAGAAVRATEAWDEDVKYDRIG